MAYENGATIAQLAERHGIHRTTVMRHLDTAGIGTRYRTADLDESKARRLHRLYKDGESIASIAAALELTTYTVGKELRRAGIQLRPRGFQPKR